MSVTDILILLVLFNQFAILFTLHKLSKQRDFSHEDASVKAMAGEVQSAMNKLQQQEK